MESFRLHQISDRSCYLLGPKESAKLWHISDENSVLSVQQDHSYSLQAGFERVGLSVSVADQSKAVILWLCYEFRTVALLGKGELTISFDTGCPQANLP